MRVLVLGGYGLIGSHVVRQLLERGHDVVGLGRDITQATRQYSGVTWIRADLAALVTADSWGPVLREVGADAVVNCAGALQDGARDQVACVQAAAMRALYAAAPDFGIKKFVQISAVRAAADGDTVFMRSKGEADDALQSSALDWVVLRPGLVLSPQAYGGTALLRALAAMPLVQPLAYPDRLIQTVSADEVGQAVIEVLEGRVETRRVYDLVEDQPHTLREIVCRLRAWLGIPAARALLIPTPIIYAVARIADGLGWLGWRSPLRTTAIRELAAGVVGDSDPWRAQTGRSLSSLETTLRTLPSTAQERWFARAFLIKPIVIAVLAIFWIVTGLIALAETGAAARVLTSRGLGEGLALAFVYAGAAVDLILGLAIVRRSSMSWAALGMIIVTLAYLLGGTLLAPDLWPDPLGPLVKAVPVIALALVALALQGDR